MVEGKPDERLDQTGAEEIANLLNKGTHFDGMLAAAVAVVDKITPNAGSVDWTT